MKSLSFSSNLIKIWWNRKGHPYNFIRFWSKCYEFFLKKKVWGNKHSWLPGGNKLETMHFCAPGRIFETRTKLQKNTPKPLTLIWFQKHYSENTKKNCFQKCSFLSVSLPEKHVSSDFLLPKNMCIFFQHSETEFGHFKYSKC